MVSSPSMKASPTPTARLFIVLPKIISTLKKIPSSKISINLGSSSPTGLTCRAKKLHTPKLSAAIFRCQSLSVSHFCLESKMSLEIKKGKCMVLYKMLKNIFMRSFREIMRKSEKKYWIFWTEPSNKIKSS